MAVLQNRKWKFSIYISHTTLQLHFTFSSSCYCERRPRSWRYMALCYGS